MYSVVPETTHGKSFGLIPSSPPPIPLGIPVLVDFKASFEFPIILVEVGMDIF